MFLTQLQINLVIQIADQVGQLIMEYYQKDYQVETKYNNTLVTSVDMLASDYLLKKLPLVLDCPVLSEEAHVEVKDYQSWQTYWLVDPIDGTKSFVNGSDEFCVCISLIHENKAIFGLILSPVDSTLYFAQKDQGTYCRTNIEKDTFRRITLTKKQKTDKFFVVTSSKTVTKKVAGIFSLLDHHGYYVKSSALKYIDVACGQADFYPSLGITCEWDSAAGQVIVEESGGNVIDLDGNRLTYGIRDTLENPRFLVCSNLERSLIRQALLRIQ